VCVLETGRSVLAEGGRIEEGFCPLRPLSTRPPTQYVEMLLSTRSPGLRIDQRKVTNESTNETMESQASTWREKISSESYGGPSRFVSSFHSSVLPLCPPAPKEEEAPQQWESKGSTHGIRSSFRNARPTKLKISFHHPARPAALQSHR
jgi:hypothetical protein